MQIQNVQSITDKVSIGAMVDGVGLTFTSHPTDINLAKELLKVLHKADPARSWHIEFQDDMIAFWCDLHDTFGYRMKLSDLGKGFKNIGVKGIGLVDLINSGAAGIKGIIK